MKIILCGYNWTGCKALRTLIDNGHEVFVYTHNNPPHINSLTEYCPKLNIPFSTQPISLDNIPFKPDIISSIYYRFIIKEEIIDLVNGKIFNLHPSLLPQYKGCSSLTWAMINGESEIGFTYHYIDEGIDTGNIIIQEKVDLEEFDTQQTLYNRVMFRSMDKYAEALNLVINSFPGIPQHSNQNESYYKRGCPYDGQINPNWSYEKTERFIRAMNFPPLPYAKFGNDEIRTIQDFLNSKNPH